MAGQIKGAEKRQRAAFARMNSKRYATFEEWRADVERGQQIRKQMRENDKNNPSKPYVYDPVQLAKDYRTDQAYFAQEADRERARKTGENPYADMLSFYEDNH